MWRRNPHVFDGEHITITRRADGTLHPNFKPMPVGMSVDNYAFEVYDELRQALKGLVEEWRKESQSQSQLEKKVIINFDLPFNNLHNLLIIN